jgi:hypothetical protein
VERHASELFPPPFVDDLPEREKPVDQRPVAIDTATLETQENAAPVLFIV